MVPIGPPPDDAQSQIDLGERPLGARRRHLLSTAARPLRLGNIGCLFGQSALQLVLDLDEDIAHEHSSACSRAVMSAVSFARSTAAASG